MSISTKIAGCKAMMKFDNRWQLIANRLFFKADIDIYRFRGCKFIVDYDGGDAAGVRECLASDMYRQFMPFMKLDGPLSIMDCGANSGGFPLLFYTEGYNLSKVVSVEMNPYTYTRLRYNLTNSLHGSVRCLNRIVEDSNNSHAIRFGNGSTGDSLLANREIGREFTVESINIDSIVKDYFANDTIDIAKIDIEGAEYILFAGENCASLSHCRYIVIEIHQVAGYKPESVIQTIRQLGFEEVHHDDDVYLFSNSRLHA